MNYMSEKLPQNQDSCILTKNCGFVQCWVSDKKYSSTHPLFHIYQSTTFTLFFPDIFRANSTLFKSKDKTQETQRDCFASMDVKSNDVANRLSRLWQVSQKYDIILIRLRLSLVFFTKSFRYQKMQVMNLVRLFWGWVFAYISLTYSLYRWVPPFLLPEMFGDLLARESPKLKLIWPNDHISPT